MALTFSRAAFEETNRRIIHGDPVQEHELPAWRSGRDWIAARALTAAEVAAERTGGPRRRFPRAKVAVRAHVAGHGRAFTSDLGFRGMALAPDRKTSLGRGDPASVRLAIAERSVYLSTRVAWSDGVRLGLEVDAMAPDDELVLQAVVCARLLSDCA